MASLLLLLACLGPRPIAAQTVAGDKAALLAFKASVTLSDPQYLSSWISTSDPCINRWQGVSCSCYPFDTSGKSESEYECTPLVDGVDPTALRVLQLNLGDLLITQVGLGLCPRSRADPEAERIMA